MLKYQQSLFEAMDANDRSAIARAELQLLREIKSKLYSRAKFEFSQRHPSLFYFTGKKAPDFLSKLSIYSEKLLNIVSAHLYAANLPHHKIPDTIENLNLETVSIDFLEQTAFEKFIPFLCKLAIPDKDSTPQIIKLRARYSAFRAAGLPPECAAYAALHFPPFPKSPGTSQNAVLSINITPQGLLITPNEPETFENRFRRLEPQAEFSQDIPLSFYDIGEVRSKLSATFFYEKDGAVSSNRFLQPALLDAVNYFYRHSNTINHNFDKLIFDTDLEPLLIPLEWKPCRTVPISALKSNIPYTLEELNTLLSSNQIKKLKKEGDFYWAAQREIQDLEPREPLRLPQITSKILPARDTVLPKKKNTKAKLQLPTKSSFLIPDTIYTKFDLLYHHVFPIINALLDSGFLKQTGPEEYLTSNEQLYAAKDFRAVGYSERNINYELEKKRIARVARGIYRIVQR